MRADRGLPHHAVEAAEQVVAVGARRAAALSGSLSCARYARAGRARRRIFAALPRAPELRDVISCEDRYRGSDCRAADHGLQSAIVDGVKVTKH